MKSFIHEVREIFRSESTEEVMILRVVERMKMIVGDPDFLTKGQFLIKCVGFTLNKIHAKADDSFGWAWALGTWANPPESTITEHGR